MKTLDLNTVVKLYLSLANETSNKFEATGSTNVNLQRLEEFYLNQAEAWHVLSQVEELNNVEYTATTMVNCYRNAIDGFLNRLVSNVFTLTNEQFDDQEAYILMLSEQVDYWKFIESKG